MRRILDLSSNRARLRIPDPTTTTAELHKASKGYSKRIVESLLTRDTISSVKHQSCVQKGSIDGRKIQVDRKEEALTAAKYRETHQGKRRLGRSTLEIMWLTVVTDILKGMNLSVNKFQYNLHINFVKDTPLIHRNCSRCVVRLMVEHALQ